jgi:hypothetical protein
MLVKEVIQALSKFDLEADIYCAWFDKQEFLTEFAIWADDNLKPKSVVEVTDEEWESIVTGTLNDDRINEAIMDSMRFDFEKLANEKEQHQETEQDQQLWEE